MSILIKGMEMPKCCYDCELIDIVTSCPHYDLPSEAYCQIDYIRKRRDKDCPLVAVPDHGDLIDRDMVLEKAWDVETFVDAVKYAPTIMAADKDGE